MHFCTLAGQLRHIVEYHFNGLNSMNLTDLPNKLYFIGIGGVSMSALARHAHKLGFSVCGSDLRQSEYTRTLQQEGITVHFGHDAAHLADAQAVVVTTAVHQSNVELACARNRGLPVYLREQLLGAFFNGYSQRIAVCGTHGKTTVTAMVSHLLGKAGRQHTAFVGGTYLGNNYRYGGNLVVAEACEYNQSFLNLHPTLTLCLNVELDHPDCYADLPAVQRAFGSFLAQMEGNGSVILPHTLSSLHCGNSFLVGRDIFASNLRLRLGKPSFDVYLYGSFVGRCHLKLFGEHNVTNALFAIAACYKLGLPAESCVRWLSSFQGVDRRFTVKQGSFCRVVCDYAHHPTEIAASISCAKRMAAKGRVFCVFQPHTYTRTQAFWQSFASCFEQAHQVIYLPIFSAREAPLKGITSSNLCSVATCLGINALYCNDFSSAAHYLKGAVSSADVVLLLGAGDVNLLADLL